MSVTTQVYLMNELKTLIDLSFTGTRLPHYEEEIFSDFELTDYYLRKLCEQYAWYDHGDSVPGMVYRYARSVMKSRWPEAEAIIATDPAWAYYYARNVMKSRWPEAEAVIATNPRWAYYYADYVMKCRWPEAESVIATDSVYRKWYNARFRANI